MWKCPVCDMNNDSPFCPQCGFDRSRDWGDLPTLGAVSGKTQAASRLRQERQARFICPVCGSDAFSVHLQSGSLQCRNCGLISTYGGHIRKKIRTIAAGDEHTVVLYEDGTVRAVGRNNCGQCNTENWTDIVSIGAGFQMTIGIKKDGSSVVAGNDSDGKSAIYKIKDLTAADGGCGGHTVCLRKDGTVRAIGRNSNGECGVEGWHDMIQVAAGFAHTVGLKRDGTVLAVGINVGGCAATKQWSDIVQIAAGSGHTLGLKRNGTVVAVGETIFEKCDVADWRDLVGVAAGVNFSAGLKRDGTVVIATDYSPIHNAECWTDVVAIAAGNEHLVGLRSDGTLLAVGSNDDGRCNVYSLCK